MPIDPMEFRRTLGRFATGVTIVTTLDGKADHGMTVNAFTSVSLDPPLVLVCCDKKAESYELLKKSRVFAVNVLQDNQKQVSINFSRHELKPIRFQNLKIRREVTGAAILEDAAVFIDCRVVAVYDEGDHDIFVGQVEKLGCKEGSDPLLFYAGKYRKIGPEI
ncbi:MAG: flavin reductase [Thaumarchaeota archaeon]|nr:flavin reductase [Nitrososphaerota archaeon]